jgi:hypothetical protein
MRFVAVEAGIAPGFSLGGSLDVVAFGAILGAPAALVFWACRVRWRLPWGAGAAAGLLLFAAVVVIRPPAASSALASTPDTTLVTTLLFAVAFASYGVLLDVLWRRLNRWDAPRGHTSA